jgi:putative NADPH-quinone reductase
MMSKRILVILGHPSSNSFCAALASKKQEIAERIAALSQQHAHLVEFEHSLERSRLDCPLNRL